MEKKKIDDVLLRLGIPAHLSGFAYITAALETALERPEGARLPVQELYQAVAEKYGVKDYQVERNIRRAIEVGWLYGDMDAQRAYFGSSVRGNTGRPTNAQLIATLAHALREEGAGE